MKKTVSLLLAFVIAIGILTIAPVQFTPFSVVAGAEETTAPETTTPEVTEPENQNTDENGFSFSLNEDGKSYTVTGYTGNKTDSLVIPSKFNEKPVTAIGDCAFQFSGLFTSAIIPDSVTTIGNSAFSFCENMIKITIPESVTYIGGSAFGMCTHLNDVVLPSKIKVIEDSTFNSCYKLSNITLPEGLERIESCAFTATSVKSINIPDSVTFIAIDAFWGCDVPNNKDYIDSGVFYLNKILMSSDSRDVPSMYKVKDGTTYISKSAFTNCHQLVSITLPKSIKTIDEYAFDGCENLSIIFYEGTLDEFNKIEFTNNEVYLSETIVILESDIHKISSKPSVKTVSNVAGGVQISWNAVNNADIYMVWRRGAGNNEWEVLGITDQTTIIDTSPTHRQYWRYSVQAMNGAGLSDFDYTGKYLKYVATPKLTGISNATNGIYFKWNAVSGASGYRVYRRAAGAKYWTYLCTVKGTNYTDKSVKDASGNYYRYTVRAVVDGLYSGYEDFLYTKRLANPTLKSATSSTNGITVKWSPIKGTTGYYVYRKTANSNWVRIGAVGGTNNTTFLDKTAKSGTTYTYTVRAVYGSTTSYFHSGIKCKR